MDRVRRKKRKSASTDALIERQGRAVLALVEAPTVEDAAQRAGVSRSILYVWLRDEGFKARLDAARAELFHEGLDALRGTMGKAARVMAALLDSRNENTRRLTAVAVLGLGMKANETIDIEMRLARLEALASERIDRRTN